MKVATESVVTTGAGFNVSMILSEANYVNNLKFIAHEILYVQQVFYTKFMFPEVSSYI